MSWHGYKPYVSVAERKANALLEMEKLRKQGREIKPVQIKGRKIARNFWGEAWCDHLESFSDYENRLPRGRTYARNGSVCHLDIQQGAVAAYVAGSDLYKVKVSINQLPKKKWQTVKQSCINQISSLLDLLQGKIPENVLETVTNQTEGLFPTPKEIKFQCDCPDYASMCKHIAAVLYGIGARLDASPELLFELRGVDVEELIDSDAEVASATAGSSKNNRISLAGLDDVFGIEIDSGDEDPAPVAKPRKKKKAAKKKTAQSTVLTSRTVIDLRNSFNMSQGDFAKLTGVSKATVSSWENKPGELKMRKNTLQEFRRVENLTETEAWAEINSPESHPSKKKRKKM